MPSVGVMNQYADDEYSSGAYRGYAKSRDLKVATAAAKAAGGQYWRVRCLCAAENAAPAKFDGCRPAAAKEER